MAALFPELSLPVLIEKLSPQPGDVLVLRYQASDMDAKAHAAHAALDMAKRTGCAWIALPYTMTVEKVDPEELRATGWVRAEESAPHSERPHELNVQLTPADQIALGVYKLELTAEQIGPCPATPTPAVTPMGYGPTICDLCKKPIAMADVRYLATLFLGTVGGRIKVYCEVCGITQRNARVGDCSKVVHRYDPAGEVGLPEPDQVSHGPR